MSSITPQTEFGDAAQVTVAKLMLTEAWDSL